VGEELTLGAENEGWAAPGAAVMQNAAGTNGHKMHFFFMSYLSAYLPTYLPTKPPGAA
jgi:hypothetical protein